MKQLNITITANNKSDLLSKLDKIKRKIERGYFAGFGSSNVTGRHEFHITEEKEGAAENIWMALVCYENDVSFSRACSTEHLAEMAIVEYLQKEEGFEGADFNEACFWIGENDLKLDLMVFEMEPDEFEITSLEEELLRVFRVLTSYTSDLLYRLDNQVDLSDIDEIQQAKEVIAKYDSSSAKRS